MMKLKNKRYAQMLVDTLMSVVLIILMSYSIAGEVVHEVLGISMLILFVIHHILSVNFTKALFRGKKSADKILKIIVDILLTLIMLVMLVSAVPLSKHLFSFLQIDLFSSISRTAHMLAGYWGFVLMSIHIGFHLPNMLAKPSKDKRKRIIIRISLLIIFALGMYFFISEGIYKYLLLINRFVYFDSSAGLIIFVIKYLFIMGMLAVLGYAVISFV